VRRGVACERRQPRSGGAGAAGRQGSRGVFRAHRTRRWQDRGLPQLRRHDACVGGCLRKTLTAAMAYAEETGATFSPSLRGPRG